MPVLKWINEVGCCKRICLAMKMKYVTSKNLVRVALKTRFHERSLRKNHWKLEVLGCFVPVTLRPPSLGHCEQETYEYENTFEWCVKCIKKICKLKI